MIKIRFTITLVCLLAQSLFAQHYFRYKTLEETSLTSKYLDSKKKISITVPIEWQENIPNTFPLLILFDRQRKSDTDYILHTIDNLTNNEQMPSVIIISIESDLTKRTAETTYSISHREGLAEKNEQFLFEELIPLAIKSYKANAFTLFIGHSRHGFFSTSLFQSRIHDLNAVISFSPFLYESNINLLDSLSMLSQTHFNGTKYYRYAIGNDNITTYYDLDSVFSKKNNTYLNTKGLLFENADHYTIPTLGISQSLYEIFEYWAIEDKKNIYTSNIKSFNLKMKTHYGQELKQSLFTLNKMAWQHYENSNYNMALNIWRSLIELYPNFSEAYLSIIQTEKKLNKDYNNTIQAFKKSLKASILYSEFKKIELLDEL